MNTGQVPPLGCTLGIDLASRPQDTAVCQIDWTAGQGRVVDTGEGALDDDRLSELMAPGVATTVAVDAPFGFPAPFTDALGSYQLTGTWPALDPNELRFRATEVELRRFGGLPLSAVTDRLIWPAMRCAGLLSRLPDAPVPRVGGRIIEVYPAAALQRWLGPEVMAPKAGSYKGEEPGRADRRVQILDALSAKLEGVMELDAEFRARCVANDDQLDGLVCALVARAWEQGGVEAIPAGSRWLALREGWIVLPTPEALGKLL
jgi:predicted nuclease with RNAse H fold